MEAKSPIKPMSPQAAYAEAWMYYLTGKFTLGEIADMLNFHLPTLTAYSGRHKWATTRKAIFDKAGEGLRQKTAERIEKARIAHQNFMLDQMEESREKIDGMKIGEADPNMPEPEEGKPKRIVSVGQKLALMGQVQDIANKVLKLDVEEKTDENMDGFRLLVALQGNTRPDDSEAPLGIIRSNNAHPEPPATLDLVDNEGAFELLRQMQGGVEDTSEEIEALHAQALKPETSQPLPTKLTFA